MNESEKIIEYKESIFHKPGQSEFLSRIGFRAFNQLIVRITGTDQISSFKRSVVFLFLLLILTGAFISGNAGDVYRIYNDDGYERASVIYAKDKNDAYVPIAEFYRQGRKIIKLENGLNDGPGSRVAKCFMAAEDNQFQQHFGIDFKGILRASLVNIMAGKIKEGASTISQQVARLRFLSHERSLLRKIREAFYAIVLEIRFDKHEIMEFYLNEVHLGHGANGVESASQFYFEKNFKDLSWGEAALLSSLTTQPNNFSPLRDINQSRSKVQVTFQKLIENGEMDIKTAEIEYKKLETEYYLTLNRSPWDSARNQRKNDHPYVTEYIRGKILKHFSNSRLLTGGLKIYTTIVVDHQNAAEQEFIPYLKKQTARRYKKSFEHFEYFEQEMGSINRMTGLLFPVPDVRLNVTRSEREFLRTFAARELNDFSMFNYLVGSSDTNRAMEHYMNYGEKFVEEKQNVEGALVSIRPVTGEITAIVGGSGFATRNQLMRFQTARRQPGSSFKPLVYSACIDHSGNNLDSDYRLTASTMIEDAPIHFVNHDLSEYSPENYSHSYDGWMRLREALVKSKNTVAVQVYKNCGPGNVNPLISNLINLKSRTGGQRKLPREAAVALGSFVVTPMEMVRAYAVFASNGREVEPYILTHITNFDGKKILKDFRPHIKKRKPGQIIGPATAKIMVSMLRDVVSRGTGRGAFLPGRRTAGKTGTTNRNTDAWFVGFTPKLVTALYLGYDKPGSLGGGATGGGLAAPVWGRYMHKALKSEKPGKYNFVDAKTVGVEICKSTGSLPTSACANRMVEMFIPGTQPTDSRSPYDDVSEDGEIISSQRNNNVIKSKKEIFTDDSLDE